MRCYSKVAMPWKHDDLIPTCSRANNKNYCHRSRRRLSYFPTEIGNVKNMSFEDVLDMLELFLDVLIGPPDENNSVTSCTGMYTSNVVCVLKCI